MTNKNNITFQGLEDCGWRIFELYGLYETGDLQGKSWVFFEFRMTMTSRYKAHPNIKVDRPALILEVMTLFRFTSSLLIINRLKFYKDLNRYH
jgi:hypothetical protein